jgi:hypothetical protein
MAVMRWRVHYHLHAAGGRLWPTSREVDAEDKTAALHEAIALQRASDSARGRAHTGYYEGAVVVPITEES